MVCAIAVRVHDDIIAHRLYYRMCIYIFKLHSYYLFSLFFFLLRFCLVSPFTVAFLAKDLDDLNKVYQSSFLCQQKTQSSSDEAE